MIELKQMTADHITQIAQIEKICFSAPWSENLISSELGNRLSFWLVAMDGDTVAGYVGSQSVLDEADMMNVAVHPDYRRQGIGEKLVLALCDALREKGIRGVMLEVRQSNAPAITLYEKLGFVHVGMRPNYYRLPRENALIMRKDLVTSR